MTKTTFLGTILSALAIDAGGDDLRMSVDRFCLLALERDDVGGRGSLVRSRHARWASARAIDGAPGARSPTTAAK